MMDQETFVSPSKLHWQHHLQQLIYHLIKIFFGLKYVLSPENASMVESDEPKCKKPRTKERCIQLNTKMFFHQQKLSQG